MSAHGRSFPDVGKKSFRPEWWNSDKLIQVNTNGTKAITGLTTSPAPNQYTQMQQNFSLFFGLALQLYQATLVSDDAPFDRFMGGNSSAMSLSAQQGLGVFLGKGKCAACHGGAEFTNASVRKVRSEPMARMIMGNGGTAVYDEGFYNIGVRPTLDDIGAGGNDPFGNPLALSALARISGTKVKELVGISPNLSVSSSERIAVNGMFKVPTLRNVELTAPFFHNGEAATLRQVVDFYNRGGNFHDQNINDLDADITNLGLTEEEKVSLVEFMKSLTDDRVRFHAAPFDHPQLAVPNGHVGSTTSVTGDGTGRAADSMLTIPAVGAAGYAKTSTPGNFLNTHHSGTPVVQFVTNNGQCLAAVLSRWRLNKASKRLKKHQKHSVLTSWQVSARQDEHRSQQERRRSSLTLKALHHAPHDQLVDIRHEYWSILWAIWFRKQRQ